MTVTFLSPCHVLNYFFCGSNGTDRSSHALCYSVPSRVRFRNGSEFWEVDRNCFRHLKYIQPQELNDLNKITTVFVNVLKHKQSTHVTHTMVSTAWLELLWRTEIRDKCFQYGTTKTSTATVSSPSQLLLKNQAVCRYLYTPSYYILSHHSMLQHFSSWNIIVK